MAPLVEFDSVEFLGVLSIRFGDGLAGHKNRQTRDGGDERGAQDAELGRIEVERVILEGQASNEESHGEADAGKTAGTDDVTPGGQGRQ